MAPNLAHSPRDGTISATQNRPGRLREFDQVTLPAGQRVEARRVRIGDIPLLLGHGEAGMGVDAGIRPEEIDYINAHATSTPVGDSSETQMLKYAIGEENAYKTPVSGTKGATGHCLGAAGAIEAMFTILAIRDGKLPPTINYEVEDPTCDLDYVPNEARDADVKVAVSNSFGFGGHNACVVFKRYED